MEFEQTERKKNLMDRINENPKKYAKRALWTLAILGTIAYTTSRISERNRIDAINSAIRDAPTIKYVVPSNGSSNKTAIRECGIAEGLNNEDNLKFHERIVRSLNDFPLEERFNVSKGEYYTLPPSIKVGEKIYLPDVNRDGVVSCEGVSYYNR